MEREPINNLMETTMQKIKEMVDTNTVVGEPIVTADGMTLIPVSKVSFGFVGGGTDFNQKNDKSGFGGGTGAGVNIVPVAFITVKGHRTEMIYISPREPSPIDKILDAVPDVLDKVSEFLDKDKE
ncbi:MAG: GerW family sporulation protein [Oscillospiraceae bacterium]|jgi:sporulation protein YtfJ|nr:GerW family sporulation protein [Oscillospiraceae bacterium]